jgi:sirohydrochlorin ferrochelatase
MYPKVANEMKALLIVAHGSRRVESNDEVRALTGRLGAQAAGLYTRVQCAFLELAEPSIPDGLLAAIREGATRVTVVPYFLSAGRHVVMDIPAEIEGVRKEYPDIDIVLAPYVGAAPGLTDLLLQQALKTQGDSD